MTLRTRLVLAFAYILTTIIVALTIPLAVNLSRRAEAEFATETLIVAQTLAARLPSDDIGNTAAVRAAVNRSLTDELRDSIERIVVVSAPDGAVVWDSEGEETIGSVFANAQRPEVASALDPARGATFDIRFSDEEGREIMVAASPVIDEGVVGAIRLTRRTDDVRSSVNGTVIAVVVIGAAGLVAGIVIAFGLAGSLARPIQRLAAAAERLGRGDLQARAGGDIKGTREIKELAGSFDEMADRVERTVRAQRAFVANASHQLRTPLTGMKLQLENAIEDEADPRLRRRLEAAELEVDRLAALIDRLLSTAREIEEGTVTHVDLHDAAQRAVERWEQRAERAGTVVEFRGGTAEAVANPADVDQVLDNLVDNALAYGAGPVDLETQAEDGQAWLTVRDHGSGIPDDELPMVTERFFRGRTASSKGSGLGLAIARELTEKWGGTMTIDEPDGGGTRVEVRFRGTDRASGEDA
jgi:signal transduction histidine kinase